MQEQPKESKFPGLVSEQAQKSLAKLASSISQNCSKLVQNLLQLIANETQPDSPEFIHFLKYCFPYKKTPTSKPLCARVLPAGSYAFRCLECMVEQNSIICIECFNKSDHKGHHYEKVRCEGCCDCGNDEMWREEGFCVEHCRAAMTDIRIDVKQMDCFVEEMRFVVFLVEIAGACKDTAIRNRYGLQFACGILQLLYIFNENSLISNQKTYKLLSSNILNLEQNSIIGQNRNYTILEFLLRTYEHPALCHRILDTFILLFTLPEFKKYLLINYCRILQKYPKIWLTQFHKISHQLFTSNKLISQLIDTKQFKPLRISPQNISHSYTLTKVVQIYRHYMVSLKSLCGLNFGIGSKYVKYHIEEGNILDFCGYQRWVRMGQDGWEKGYNVQYEFLSYFPLYVLGIAGEKKILMKGIRDVVESLKAEPEETQLSFYIPKQRLLLMLTYLYFECNIQQAYNKLFLTQTGLTPKILYRILQAVLHVVRFYGLVSSNKQSQVRYQRFFVSSLYILSRRNVSIDFQLIKLCIIGLREFESQELGMGWVDTCNPEYQAKFTYASNRLPLDRLLAMPIRPISILLSAQIGTNQDSIYDRKKAVGYLTDYLGLLHQILITNHSDLNIKNLYNLNNELELVNFYGTLLRSLKKVKSSDLRKIQDTFFDIESSPCLKEFIMEYCEVGDGWVTLKKHKESIFTPINLSYLKDKKWCLNLLPYIQANQKQFPLAHKPTLQSQSPYLPLLKSTLLSPHFVHQLIRISNQYLTIMLTQENIRKSDMESFSSLIEELIRINYTMENKEIVGILGKIRGEQGLFGSMSEFMRREIGLAVKVLGEEGHKETGQHDGGVDKEKIEKMKSLKQKKLQKFKQKQTQTYQKLKSSQLDMQNQQIQQSPEATPTNQCIYCRQPNPSYSLKSLANLSRETLFSSHYLGTVRPVYRIMACGHVMHSECFWNAYEHNGGEVYCDFCRFYSNLQLEVEGEGEVMETAPGGQPQGQKPTLPKLSVLQSIEQALKKIQHQLQPNLLKSLHISPPSHITQSPSTLSLAQKLIQALSTAILQAVLINFNNFIKMELKSWIPVVRELKREKIGVEGLLACVWDGRKEAIKRSQEKEGNIGDMGEVGYWFAYQYTIERVVGLLLGKEEGSEGLDKLKQMVPKQLLNLIDTIIKSLSSQDCYNTLCQLTPKIQPLDPPKFTQLPPTLQELSNLGGQCPNCSLKTNQLALCLLCPFISCLGCKAKNLTYHALTSHGWSSIYIRLDTGFPIYISGLARYQLKSIYYNYMNQMYDAHGCKELSMGTCYECEMNPKKKEDYGVGKGAVEMILKDLVKGWVRQEIEYRGGIGKGKFLTALP